jgi:hypothetical protein
LQPIVTGQIIFDKMTKKRVSGVDFIDDLTIIDNVRRAQRQPQNTDRRKAMTTQIEKQIKDAIARSISHNEIVHITIDGDSGDALSAIESVRDVDTETDYTMADYEGIDTMDVWGWTEQTPENEQDWRLAIRFAGDVE